MFLTPHNSRIDEILAISKEKVPDYDQLSVEIDKLEKKMAKLKKDATLQQSDETNQTGNAS